MKKILLLLTFLLQTSLIFANVNGHVFTDANNDGFFNEGENPQISKLVYLYEGEPSPGNLITQTYTNYFGFYEFKNLSPGFYTVVIKAVPIECDTKSYLELGNSTYKLNFTTNCSESDCCDGSFYEFSNDHLKEGFSHANCDGTVTIEPEGLSPCHQITISWKDGETTGPFTLSDLPLNLPSNDQNEVIMLVEELDNYGQVCFSGEISESVNFENCGGCESCHIEAFFSTSTFEGQSNIIQFENLSSLDDRCDFLSFYWEFGDGLFSEENNPVHTYNSNGLFEVCLIISYESPGEPLCEEVVCKEIEIKPPPTCNDCEATTEFSTFPVDTIPFAVQFENLSTLKDDCEFTNFSWIFGDGQSSNESSPTHQYFTAGDYSVCLIADFQIDGIQECLTAVCDIVTVLPPVTCEDCSAEPAFSFQTPDPTNLSINFENQSSLTDFCDFTSFNWDFGDGQTSDANNPTHEYQAAGNYNVCLKTIFNAPNQQGCVALVCDSITVIKPLNCDGCVEPAFSSRETASLLYQFDNETRVTDECGINTVLWNFGDGQTSDEFFPSHQYHEPGIYNVCLLLEYTVELKLKCSTSICDSLLVEKPPVCEDCNIEPNYSFIASDIDPFQIQYQNQVTIHDDCDITSYSWNFGDGLQSDENNPIHQYNQEGIYEVCLTVEYESYHGLNCSSVICDLVIVEPRKQCEDCEVLPFFSFEKIPTQSTGVVFKNESLINSNMCEFSNFIWDFGDSQISEDENPTHHYENPGTYEVCLLVNYQTLYEDCNDKVCREVVIDPLPTCEDCEAVPGFTFKEINFYTVEFTDNSSLNNQCLITSWNWNFGDGEESTERNPAHTYSKTGLFTVCLTLTFDRTPYINCEIEVCETVEIGDPDLCKDCVALVDFDYDNLGSLKVEFLNDVSTKEDCLVTQLAWDFGDGTSSNENNPTHLYEESGIYNVCMKVKFDTPGGLNCESFICDSIVVSPLITCDDCTVESVFSIEETSMTNRFKFMNESTEDPNCPIKTFRWEFGDGQESVEQNPTHVYETEGVFTVRLITDFITKDSDIICKTVSTDSVNVDLIFCEDCEIHPAIGSQNLGELAVQLTSETTINNSCEIVEWKWNFGDGQESVEENPVHQYETPGEFLTRLNIKYVRIDGETCEAIVSDTIIVDKPDSCDDCIIEPGFSFKTSDTAANIFHFTNTTTVSDDCKITATKWTFGDGNESNELNPIHTYQTEDSLLVCLNIEYITAKGKSCKTFVCDTVVVNLPTCDDCIVIPKQSHEVLDSFKVAFFNNSSIEGEGCIIDSILWEFDGQETSKEANPTHQYSGAGNFLTCLNLFYSTANDLNCSTFICDTVKIDSIPVCEVCNILPDFAATENGNLEVQFNDLSTLSNTCSITGHLWEFHDGEQSTDQNPTHIYNEPGDFEVCLTVFYDTPELTDCEAVKCQTITVNPVCEFCQTQADFDFIVSDTSKTTLIFNDTTSLNNTCKINSWAWDFDDGETSAEENPVHSFKTGGTFNICLTVNFSTPAIPECTEKHCEKIVVTNNPIICERFINLGNQMLINRDVSASGRILSSGTVPANMHAMLSAEESVELNAGFSAERGASLEILNRVCEDCEIENTFLNNILPDPRFDQFPPIAKNISIQILDEVTSCNENLLVEASFEKEDLNTEFHVVILNDEKCVLRDDGKGADKEAGDGTFSLFLNEDIDRIQNILDQAKETNLNNNADFLAALSDSDDPNIIIDQELVETRGVVINTNTLSPPPSPLNNFDVFTTDEIDAVIDDSESVTITLEQLLLGRETTDFDAEKTMMLTDLSVIEDEERTFNPCTGRGKSDGIWTFGELMRQLASSSPGAKATDAEVSEFVLNWLNTWMDDATVNGEVVAARRSINTRIIEPWQAKSLADGAPIGQLSMKFAPFRLTAIVNRFDLRGSTGFTLSDAGEGRFVFCALTENCFPLPFTVIFEYGINKNTCADIKAYAQGWADLNKLTLGTTDFNEKLVSLTNQFALSGTNVDKPNQSSLNQLRTNEIALAGPWELREFKLTENGQLTLDPVDLEPAVKYNTKEDNNNVELLVDFINNLDPPVVNNQYEVPLQHLGINFLGGKAHTESPPTGPNPHHWDGASTGAVILEPLDRHVFSLNTCSGCHGGETQTSFTHIDPAGFGDVPNLSGFLTGIAPPGIIDADGEEDGRLTVNDPAGNNFQYQFNDLRRREIDLDLFLATNCVDFKLLELVHKMSVRPLNMVH